MSITIFMINQPYYYIVRHGTPVCAVEQSWAYYYTSCFLWSKVYNCVMMGFGFNGCFVIGAPCLNVGHNYDFASSVGHLRSNSGRATSI
jgi:hypothetical protein